MPAACFLVIVSCMIHGKLTTAENVAFFIDPVNDSGLPLIKTCPAVKPAGKVPARNPLATFTETLPKRPSRTTVTEETVLPERKRETQRINRLLMKVRKKN